MYWTTHRIIFLLPSLLHSFSLHIHLERHVSFSFPPSVGLLTRQIGLASLFDQTVKERDNSDFPTVEKSWQFINNSKSNRNDSKLWSLTSEWVMTLKKMFNNFLTISKITTLFSAQLNFNSVIIIAFLHFSQLPLDAYIFLWLPQRNLPSPNLFQTLRICW